MNKVFIFVGGIFDNSNIQNYIENSSNSTNFAAHNYFNRLIDELSKKYTVYVCSSPYLGKFKFNTFSKNNDCFIDTPIFKYGSCPTQTLRRLSFLTRSLMNAFKKIDISVFDNKEVFIFTTQPNIFYIQAALKIKKILTKSKLICFVPDLTIYSNLSKQNKLMKILKFIESKFVNKKLAKFSGNIYFSKHMGTVMKYKKPNIVLETIVSEFPEKANKSKKTILYTGTLNSVFNVLEFVNCFLKKNEKDIKLCIAGNGEDAEYLKTIRSDNFEYLGVLSPLECNKLQKEASVLVNPRKNDEVYTKYSFPSKIGEYLSYNGVVACFKLSGIPDEYDSVLKYPKENTIESLVELSVSLCKNVNLIDKIRDASKEFLKTKTPKYTVSKLLDFLKNL